MENTINDKIIIMLVDYYKQISIKSYLEELDFYKKKIADNQKKNKLKCAKCGRVLSSAVNYKNHVENNQCVRVRGHSCNYCGKHFTRKHNYRYHINNNICGLVKDSINENIENQLDLESYQQVQPQTQSQTQSQIQPQTQAQNQIQQITNNTNNTNNTDNSITNNTTNTSNTANTTNIQTQNNNNQQNIIIAVSGKDDIEEVCKQVSKLIPFRYTKYKPSVQDLISYFNNPNKAIQQIIINEHFNPAKPEQMNIHNTNCRSNRMQVFDEDENGSERWITRDKTDVCDDLYEKSVNEMFFAKHNLKLKGYRVSSEKEKNMNDKIHQLETNKKVRKEYMNKISDITWDYKDVVQANRRNAIKN